MTVGSSEMYLFPELFPEGIGLLRKDLVPVDGCEGHLAGTVPTFLRGGRWEGAFGGYPRIRTGHRLNMSQVLYHLS